MMLEPQIFLSSMLPNSFDLTAGVNEGMSHIILTIAAKTPM